MIAEKKPAEVWDILKTDKKALLVDVRTPEEWEMVGYPDLSSIGKEVVRISFQDIHGNRNEQFIQQLNPFITQADQPLFFMCLIGGRSRMAAMLAHEAGFANVFNVQDGFEGVPDTHGKRGHVNGWQASGLPYVNPVSKAMK